MSQGKEKKESTRERIESGTRHVFPARFSKMRIKRAKRVDIRLFRLVLDARSAIANGKDQRKMLSAGKALSLSANSHENPEKEQQTPVNVRLHKKGAIAIDKDSGSSLFPLLESERVSHSG